MLNFFLARVLFYVTFTKSMAILTTRKRQAMNFVFTALGTLQRSNDLEMAHDATELEIELRQAFGLPLVRHSDNHEASAAAGKGTRQ